MSDKRKHRRLPAVGSQAISAARASRLPGWTSGPADAFRHIVASAEAARRHGARAALILGELNEQKGNWFDGQGQDDLDMDRTNNRIGREIGRGAKSFEEIVARTKQRIFDAAAGTLPDKDRPVWLSKDRWLEDTENVRDRGNWPPVWNEGRADDADRILARPVGEWSSEDARTVQDSRTYLRDGPARDTAFEKVRQWYETRSGAVPEAGGPVSVSAYVRGDGSRVSGHSRAAPQREGLRR